MFLYIFIKKDLIKKKHQSHNPKKKKIKKKKITKIK